MVFKMALVHAVMLVACGTGIAAFILRVLVLYLVHRRRHQEDQSEEILRLEFPRLFKALLSSLVLSELGLLVTFGNFSLLGVEVLTEGLLGSLILCSMIDQV